MKKNIFERWSAVLDVIADALAEPADLIGLSLQFGAGSRTLTGMAEPADDQAALFRYQLPGNSGVADAPTLASLLRETSRLYDSCRVELHQRGQNRFFAADERGVRLGTLDSVRLPAERDLDEGISERRDYLIRTSEAAVLLQAIGVTDASGRLRQDKIRKYHQIDRFVELAEPMLRELCRETASLQVIDLACGKSYLAFVLNYFIREKLKHPCTFIGIDRAAGVVESSRQLAAKLGYRNMTFAQADLSAWAFGGQPGLCISLHACDLATDLALAAAVRARSRAIIAVPCCQRELLAAGWQLPPHLSGLLEHGVLKTRLADILTDELRLLLLQAAGYDASLIEYVSPLDTPKNLMIRARMTGRRDERAIREYRELTAQLGQTITLGRIMEESDYGRHFGDGQPG
jgi:hypothetical protein